MLADQDHPLEDAIAEADERPDPQVVVVYRTRGVPWLLVPPLLLLAGVAAIVVYRRSADPDRAAIAWRESARRAPAKAAVEAPTPSATTPDARSRVDAVAELTAATGRPVSAQATAPEGPRFDPTPPPAEPDPASVAPAPSEAKPAPAPAEPVHSQEAPKAPEPAPAPAPAEPKARAVDAQAPAPIRVAARSDLSPAVPAPAELPGQPRPPAADPFDPLVATPTAPAPAPVDPPPAADPPARQDRVGFDPEARPATLDEEARPAAPPPAAEQPAGPAVPPPAEQPFALDRRPPALGAVAAEARRAERTREIEEDIQAEAERRLAEQLRLKQLMPSLLNPDPIEARRRLDDFKTAVRRLAAQQRPEFHEELKRLIREQGRAAGPEIKAARDRFGVDTLPEIMVPAARDLTQVASRLTTPEKVRRMRQWGLPETMILDELYERQLRDVGTRGAARNEEEAWVFAAWVLLHYPPTTPRANAQPAPGR